MANGASEQRQTRARSPLAPPRLPLTVLIASLGVNLMTLALPLVMLQIFDRVMPFQAHETLLVLCLGLGVAIVLDFVLKACRIILMSHAAERFETRVNAAAARAALDAAPDDFERESASARFDRLNAVAQLRDHIGGPGRLLAIDLPFVTLFAAMIWYVGGWLVAVPIACVICLVVVCAAMRRMQARLFDARQSVDARRYAFLTEFLERIATVKAHRMEQPMLRRYELLQAQSVEASRRLIHIAGLSQAFGAIFSQVAVAAMGLFGAFLVVRGEIGVAELAACTLLNSRAVQPLLKLIGLWAQAEGVAAARRKAEGMLALPSRRAAAPARSLAGAVELRDVEMRVPGRGAPLFSGLSFAVRPGACAAITGADGAGKTTLMRLLLGEAAPSAGAALIDGAPAADFVAARGVGGVAYVDQAPVVFQGSILDNIALVAEPERVEAGLAAARALGLDEEIRRLPFGYETRLGAGGGSMSLGFLQRIALARCLALRPRILLFNEANTAMDRPSDRRALAAIAALAGGTTVILVTRRPAWIALAETQVTLAGSASTVFRIRREAAEPEPKARRADRSATVHTLRPRDAAAPTLERSA